MKRWQVIAAILFPLVLTISLTGYARAADWRELPPLYGEVITKAAVLVDKVLGHWVAGNSLSSHGEQLVWNAAHTVVTTVHFLAKLITLF